MILKSDLEDESLESRIKERNHFKQKEGDKIGGYNPSI
jgi:hypothetical protein